MRSANELKWDTLMCRRDTQRAAEGRAVFRWGALVLLVCAGAAAQNIPNPDWRKVGGASIDLALASPATGPVESVWFSADGSRVYARTRSGRLFETVDFESWTSISAGPARPDNPAPASVERLPEPRAALRADTTVPGRVYALGAQLYRSDDGGRTWNNLTGYHNQPVIGPRQNDLAVSPRNPDSLVVANEYGVWRSMDGGFSWLGMNQSLPNLPASRILLPPGNGAGVRLQVEGIGAVELPVGRSGPAAVWEPVSAALSGQLERAWSAALATEVTAVAGAGEVVYAGAADGRIWVSADRGRTWNVSPKVSNGPIESLFVDARAPRLALATAGGSGAHVLRTTNTGAFWDDLTANLPDAPEHGVTAARSSDGSAGAVYVAGERGVFYTPADLEAAGPATNWISLTGGLPAVPARDVKLDSGGNQLYVVLDGYGVYAAPAPHRMRALRLVNAADLSSRAAAPGSLVSVLGARVQSARAGNLSFPVLASSDTSSQIQVPFEVSGPSVSLVLEAPTGGARLGLPVQNASPAIFVDADGAPMILDADTGLMLDAGNTARSNSRIQVLLTGLGKVHPDWPTGMPAPISNPPAVTARVAAFVDRAPVEVTRATLMPGYVGFYLVEIQLPSIVNSGPAELYMTADGQESNRVRIWLEP